MSRDTQHVTLAPAPGKSADWMPAVESLAKAYRNITMALLSPRSEFAGWHIDKALLQQATPFAWGAPIADTVMAASISVPADTPMTPWNLNTDSAWWHFATPLPIQTDSSAPDIGIRAINIGWIYLSNGELLKGGGGGNGEMRLAVDETPLETSQRLLLHGTQIQRVLGIRAWIDESDADSPLVVVPSMTMMWLENQTIEGAVQQNERIHDSIYGEGGEHASEKHASSAAYGRSVMQVLKFIVASLAWLDQRLLVQEQGTVQRHRRKDIARTLGLSLERVHVVALRRTQRKVHKCTGPDDCPTWDTEGCHCHDGDRAWSCQWTVSGHWRHQVCGVGRADRKLTYIHPYIKGPEDKPMRAPRPTIYTVNR